VTKKELQPLPRYAIPAPQQASLAIAGSDELFPVHRIYCVGRNYAAHAREMGSDPNREPPFFFCKPADALVPDQATMAYPLATKSLHHEVELVVALKSGGKNIPVAQASACIFGYAVGIDLTRRDLQDQAKATARPWDMSKGFDQSAPCGALAPAGRVAAPDAAAITLKINGAMRQQGNTKDLIWNVAETIAHLSGLVELKAGDLIFTGTPEGVGEVKAGDSLEAEVAGIGSLTFRVAG
jgi:fumarylpyruvate hydrolase